MAHEFLVYLKEKYKWSADTVVSLSDKAAKKKWSIFHYLYNADDLSEYGMEETELLSDLLAFFKQEGRELHYIPDSCNMEFESVVYSRFGSASEVVTEYFIPLHDRVSNTHYVLTKCPDSYDFVSKIESIYAGFDWGLAICDSRLWAVFKQLYIEPMTIRTLAGKLQMEETPLKFTNNRTAEMNMSDIRLMLSRILTSGFERRASDVHFIPTATDTDVRFRIDGVYQPYTRIPNEALKRICKIVMQDAGKPDHNVNITCKGKFNFEPRPGIKLDMRLSIIPCKYGRDLNIRYLSDKLFTLQETGLSADHIRQYNELLQLPAGILYVTGPVGSGKTSTIFSGVQILAESYKNVITVEDPVEYTVQGITQVDVDEESGSGLTFESVLSTVLRHDPDVVLVGEMRTPEVAKQAMRIANTGRLVISTVHTNDSIGVFERMRSLDVDDYTIGEVSAAIITQRLVRRLCAHCREPYYVEPNSEEANIFNIHTSKPLKFFKPRGCRYCMNTGYHGRIAIAEIMVITPDIRTSIQQGATRAQYESILNKAKFHTMLRDGLEKAMLGLTSLEELKKYANDIISFRGKPLNDDDISEFVLGRNLYGKN